MNQTKIDLNIRMKNKTTLLPTKTPRAGWECLKIYDSKYTGLVVYATKTLHCIALKD